MKIEETSLKHHQLIIKSLEDICINEDIKLIKRSNISKLNYYFTKIEWKLDMSEKIKINCLMNYIKQMKEYMTLKKGNVDLMKEDLYE